MERESVVAAIYTQTTTRGGPGSGNISPTLEFSTNKGPYLPTTTASSIKFSGESNGNGNISLDLLKEGGAELIGTAILMLIGCGGCIGGLGVSPSPLHICFSFGFAVVIAITSVGHISGAHINPSVTIGSLICGGKSAVQSVVYIASQFLGSIVGFGILKLLTPPEFLHGGNPATSANFCVTLVNPQVSVIQGIFCEIIATGILVFMACAVGDSRNSRNTDSTSIKFGFAVTVLCLTFVPFTACSLNPARSFGPALLNNQWKQLWVFMLGPIIGAVIASLTYKFVFLVK